MTEKNKHDELAEKALDKLSTVLKDDLPDRKQVMKIIKQDLKEYSATVKTIIHDIANDYVAYKKKEFSDDPIENEEWYQQNIKARKLAISFYALKLSKEEATSFLTFLEKIAEKALPILSVFAKELILSLFKA